MAFTFFLTSALTKVFPSERPAPLETETLSVFPGSKAAVQLVYHADGGEKTRFHLRVTGTEGCSVRMRDVALVPSDYPCWEVEDSDYLTKEPGLFPDLLTPSDGFITPLPRQWRSVWLTFDVPADTPAGTREITITAEAPAEQLIPNGEVFRPTDRGPYACRFSLRVMGQALPPQRLLHTEWFHTDFLAAYYHVAPLSEEGWRILEKYIRGAAEHGINLLLTPVFTPPLDTAVGGERATVQLVGIAREGERYSFDFSLLARWAKLCREAGVTHLEMPHLFTQWGARATPKIMACVDGMQRRIFGWDVPATSPEYRAFLQQFLPALRAELERLGYDNEHVYYHISDEPTQEHLESYRAAKAQAEDLLEGCHVIDALSDFDFYREGVVREPIPSVDHIQPFLDANADPLWAYYCCAQGERVPNRFFAMPSYRNRILGVLLYRYHIKGFLQWGFNYYGAQFALRPIDPYRDTHAGYAFPSGDAFLVYPGPDGEPLSSIRAEVQDDALCDLRALELLESLAGRAFTERLVDEAAGGLMTFSDYPRSDAFLLRLHEAVADEIANRTR